MKKIYISPATDVYKFIIRDGILSDMSTKYGTSTFSPGEDWGQGGENSSVVDSKGTDDVIDDVDYARNGGGSIWDNVW